MRPLRLASIVLLLAGPAGLAHGGGFDKDGKPLKPEGVERRYEPVPLPVSARAARTWVALHETMVKPPPDRTPFKDVLRAIRAAVRGDGKARPPFELYIDPTTLQEQEITMATPVVSPLLGPEEVSLHTYLSLMLDQFGLIHYVHDGLVMVDSPQDDGPGWPSVSVGRARAWLMLQEEASLNFPDETPLGDVLRAIRRATIGKGPGGRGLTIHVDHLSLKGQEKTLASTVTLDLERAPLCTALGLVLRQLGLGFRVRDDGVVSITGEGEESLELMDEAEAVLAYQTVNYAYFWEVFNAERAMEGRAGRPSEKAGGSGVAPGPRP